MQVCTTTGHERSDQRKLHIRFGVSIPGLRDRHRNLGPARLCGIEGCWHRLGSLCHEDAAGFEVGGVGEAVGAAPEHLEQVVYALDAAV